MKMLLLAAIIAIAPGYARAEFTLAEPEVLLQEAAKGRTELRGVVNDMTAQVTEIRSADVFDKYFAILPQLEQLAVDLKLNEFVPDAVGRLGWRFSNWGIKWLKGTKDSKERVLYYHRYADAQVAGTWVHSMGMVARELPLDKVVELKTLADNVDALIPLADAKFKEDPSLRMAYRQLISDIAIKFLRKPELSEQDILYWLTKIYVPATFGEFLTQLNDQVLMVTGDTKALLHVFLKRTVAVKEQIERDPIPAPVTVTSQVGDIAVEVVLRSLMFRESLSKDEIKSALSVMSTRHIQALGSRLMVPEAQEIDIFAPHIGDVLLATQAELFSRGLTRESTEFGAFVSKVITVLVVQRDQLEGVYSVKDEAGKEYLFTLILGKEDQAYAALSDKARLVNKAYMNVSFNYLVGEFSAANRFPDSDAAQNNPVRFKIAADGTIALQDFTAQAGRQKMKGVRVSRFPNYMLNNSVPGDVIDGTYSGKVAFPDGSVREMRLEITMFNGYSYARMDDSVVRIEFNLGSRSDSGYIYLTTGILPSKSWIHLRFYKVGDKIHGFLISGAAGVSKEFELVQKK